MDSGRSGRGVEEHPAMAAKAVSEQANRHSVD
ncbi:MAG: hypothetical protein FD180_756 [Planctomycetota bacterium]|nr:MAG: hypothetical protein FD180_756 [Planctomycetota bacterium]